MDLTQTTGMIELADAPGRLAYSAPRLELLATANATANGAGTQSDGPGTGNS